MAVNQEPIVKPDENTPLLPIEAPQEQRKWSKSVAYLALLCGFMISLSFAVTQVPLIYVFHLMTCDAYYKTHPEQGIIGRDRCSNHEIEAGTARAVSLLGTTTSFFGIINLFIAGWTIKRVGVKYALAIQVFFPAVRLGIQNIGVMTGGGSGILIIQLSQIITIVGGPFGYLLALNTFLSEVVEHQERTGALGQLQGCALFGTSIGYLAGGIMSDAFGINAPFRATVVLFLISCSFVCLCLPALPQNEAVLNQSAKGLKKFFGPLRILAPQKWRLPNGATVTEYGTLLLGIGVLLGVLATGYIQVLLQMYATDVFGFGTTKNAYLVSLNTLIRGLFLTLAFPKIISTGRHWLNPKKRGNNSAGNASPLETPEAPIEATQFDEVEAIENEEQPINPPKPSEEHEVFLFDLFFTKYSLLADGILTGAATFVKHGWQMYLIAVLLPFASGTGAAAKGSILQMCSSSDRADALSAITFIEMMGRLLTTFVFGLIFAAFTGIGQPYLVFTCNAAVALLGFIVLLFARFPVEGSERFREEQTHEAIETD